jgi:lipoate-protein ligase A
MFLCDLTLPTPGENLACDEALLDLCEAGSAGELLRLWEPSSYFVVLGYANAAAAESNLEFCRRKVIPVLRRCSGGGTVLQGPGCLNYSLILKFDESGPLRSIPATNDFILERLSNILSPVLGARAQKEGHTDLAIGGLKFCGNAQRRRQSWLLFHGSFLLHLDIGMVEKTLRLPSKQPEYRAHRSHSDFLVNVKVQSDLVKSAMASGWAASERFDSIPYDRVELLVREKYSRDEWNLKFT